MAMLGNTIYFFKAEPYTEMKKHDGRIMIRHGPRAFLVWKT
jgi:hypothetical protein